MDRTVLVVGNPQKRINKAVLASVALSNFGGVCIERINYGIDDTVTHFEKYDETLETRRSTSKIRYTNPRGEDAEPKPYFMRSGRRYYIDEFMRTNL